MDTPQLIHKTKHRDRIFRRLLIIDIMLSLILIGTIAGGLTAAANIVKAADENTALKVAQMEASIVETDLSGALQSYTATQVVQEEIFPNYSLEQIYSLDLRKPSGATEADLKRVSKAGLVGLESTFLRAEAQYGVNAIFLMSIASLESAHGTQMFRPNNMFGYGGKGYSSKAECIMDVAKGLSSNYLRPGASLYGGSPTLKGVNVRYAANPQWYAKVGQYMKSYYSVISPYHNQYLKKIQ